MGRCLDLLEDASVQLGAMEDRRRDAEAGATAFLHLAALATLGWIACRLAVLPPADPVHRTLIAAGRFWLSDIGDKAVYFHAEALRGGGRLDLFQDVQASLNE